MSIEAVALPAASRGAADRILARRNPLCDGADGTCAYRLYELGSALLPPAGVKAV
jgi:hypothetical protein